MTGIRVVVAAITMLWAGQMAAVDFPGQATGNNDGYYYTPEEQDWSEGEVTLPALPAEEKLLVLSLTSTRFQYLIDSESLYVDPAHPLVRYMLVLVSPSGVRNTMYEGMRCDNGQFRRYAYSVGNGPLQRARSADWQEITSSDGYHMEMYKYYMCNFSYKLSREDILQRIRYPQNHRNE